MKEIKKAGILTFHCVENYGAVLQCLALQEALKPYFDSVEVIDYCPEYLLRDYKAINTYSIKSRIMSLYSLLPFLKKKAGFRCFVKKHLNLSCGRFSAVSDITDVDSNVLFVGSDQIWNSKITDGYDSAFFGKLPGYKNKKVVSYAASLGQYQLSENEKSEFFELLENVDSISVREDEGVELIASNTGKVASLVVDPTLLVDEAFWNKLKCKKKPKEEYVLIYNLTGAPELFEIADMISKEKGIKIIEINGRRKGLSKKAHKTIYSASPQDFIDLISNASYVVTDSFHGTAFSIIFKKNFTVIPHKTRGGRMKTLLAALDLENRLFNTADEKILSDTVDYIAVDKKLSELREKSRAFIINSIKE